MLCTTLFLTWLLPQTLSIDTTQLTYKVKGVECHGEPEYVTNISCVLKPISWEKSIVNLSTVIIKPLKNITANFQILRHESRYVPFLFNITKNVCELFQKKNTDFVSNAILRLLRRFSDVPFKCPMIGRVSVKDAYLEANQVIVAMPVGIYQAIFTFWEGYPFMFSGSVKFNVDVQEKRSRKG